MNSMNFYGLLISDRFALNKEDLRPYLEWKDLKEAIEQKKLFIIDYRIFDGIQGIKGRKVKFGSTISIIIPRF